ncbi:MAG: ferredoxin reductase [Deltaproteobacteria bacterium]|nr:ferredoxin reductase [Deltaproteobacteria bacterium]
MKSATSIWSRLADVAGLVATPLVPSHYIALVSPLSATHSRRARIEAVHDETAEVRSLTLRTGRGWVAHRAGQHIRVQVAVDGRLTTRMYSIASREGDERITITIKAQGRVSRALHAMKPGEYLSIGLPEGDFVLPDTTTRALFITGGSGITPIASMVRTLASRCGLRDIVHVHYARTPDDEIFGRELRALAAAQPGYRLTIIHSNVDPRLLSTERLDELVPDWRTRQTWACGPASMLAAIESIYGASPKLHLERFAAALAPLPANDSGGRVRFLSSRAEARTDGRTPLLQVAETAGINAPHGCRMGICHSCDATLVRGCARDLRTGDLAEPGARIQICVCAAAGDIELDL